MSTRTGSRPRLGVERLETRIPLVADLGQLDFDEFMVGDMEATLRFDLPFSNYTDQWQLMEGLRAQTLFREPSQSLQTSREYLDFHIELSERDFSLFDEMNSFVVSDAAEQSSDAWATETIDAVFAEYGDAALLQSGSPPHLVEYLPAESAFASQLGFESASRAMGEIFSEDEGSYEIGYMPNEYEASNGLFDAGEVSIGELEGVMQVAGTRSFQDNGLLLPLEPTIQNGEFATERMVGDPLYESVFLEDILVAASVEATQRSPSQPDSSAIVLVPEIPASFQSGSDPFLDFVPLLDLGTNSPIEVIELGTSDVPANLDDPASTLGLGVFTEAEALDSFQVVQPPFDEARFLDSMNGTSEPNELRFPVETQQAGFTEEEDTTPNKRATALTESAVAAVFQQEVEILDFSRWRLRTGGNDNGLERSRELSTKELKTLALANSGLSQSTILNGIQSEWNKLRASEAVELERALANAILRELGEEFAMLEKQRRTYDLNYAAARLLIRIQEGGGRGPNLEAWTRAKVAIAQVFIGQPIGPLHGVQEFDIFRDLVLEGKHSNASRFAGEIASASPVVAGERENVLHISGGVAVVGGIVLLLKHHGQQKHRAARKSISGNVEASVANGDTIDATKPAVRLLDVGHGWNG